MSYKTKVTSKDGHQFNVTRSDADNIIGGIVILHAVYGVTRHIENVCDRFAAEGISASAPWIFDRVRPNVVHPYNQTGTDSGQKMYSAISKENLLLDIEACLLDQKMSGPVAVCGFCTGGTWAWVAADTLMFDAAICYYASQISDHIDRKPNCPTEMHYGDSDFIVPVPIIQKFVKRHPEVPCHIYRDQNHAFFNPEQKFYNAEAANLVWERSLTFLKKVFISEK